MWDATRWCRGACGVGILGVLGLFLAACGMSEMEPEDEGEPPLATCEPGVGSPLHDPPEYDLEGTHADSELSGFVTRFDSSLRIIVLGPEPGGDSDPEAGMNIWLDEPEVRTFGTTTGCYADVTSASLVQADQRVGTGDEVNARSYAFAPNADTGCRDAARVAISYISDDIISVSSMCIPLQRVLAVPPFTGDVIGVTGTFTAASP